MKAKFYLLVMLLSASFGLSASDVDYSYRYLHEGNVTYEIKTGYNRFLEVVSQSAKCLGQFKQYVGVPIDYYDGVIIVPEYITFEGRQVKVEVRIQTTHGRQHFYCKSIEFNRGNVDLNWLDYVENITFDNGENPVSISSYTPYDEYVFTNYNYPIKSIHFLSPIELKNIGEDVSSLPFYSLNGANLVEFAGFSTETDLYTLSCLLKSTTELRLGENIKTLKFCNNGKVAPEFNYSIVNLKRIIVNAPIPPSVTTDLISMTSANYENIVVLVPDESVELYRNADFWKEFGDNIKGIEASSISETSVSKEVAGVKYVNLMGVESAEPFSGVNVKVTTFSDGTRSAEKVLR